MKKDEKETRKRTEKRREEKMKRREEKRREEKRREEKRREEKRREEKNEEKIVASCIEAYQSFPSDRCYIAVILLYTVLVIRI